MLNAVLYAKQMYAFISERNNNCHKLALKSHRGYTYNQQQLSAL